MNVIETNFIFLFHYTITYVVNCNEINVIIRNVYLYKRRPSNDFKYVIYLCKPYWVPHKFIFPY